jgi:hypothetical protein
MWVHLGPPIFGGPFSISVICDCYRCCPRSRNEQDPNLRQAPTSHAQDIEIAVIGADLEKDVLNRDTVANVVRAGFELVREMNVYLDVVKAIDARRP